MSYYIRALPNKKSEPKWKVQYVSFKKSDYKESQAKFPKKEWDISKTQWSALGFYRYMTLDEAKVRARQLNSHLEIKRQEVRLLKLEETNRLFQKRFDSVLPEKLYTAKRKMKLEQFNWLYLSVWLGLRPQEVDNLKNNELWRIEENSNPKILWVFQTKIISLPTEDR